MLIYNVVISVLVVIGFAICLYFLLRHKRKSQSIQHYEDIRDKLTLREEEPDPEPEEEQEYQGGFLGNLIGGFITILIGFNLLPTIITEVENAGNVAGANAAVLALVVPMFIITILVTGIGIVAQSFRKVGLI